ncbi:hypothetical protein CCYA_CCYA07G2049 [Cyanidiococcus yangmingshanensis]|nr:hypothetical protein CCYA_CCYA07G2049 [Cyanidiococcus yangmingshanensis]
MLSRRLQTILITLSFFCLWKYAEAPRNFFGRSLCNAREAPGLTSNHYGKSAGSNETRSVDVEAESTLFALLQISDLHLDYRQSFALQNLRAILYDVIPIVAPKAVIVTGDITNAKRRRGLGHVSQQFAEEWSQYADAVRQARVEGAVPSDTIWIDLPGNHDMFGVLKRPEPEKNFYLQHCQLHHPNTNGTCLQPRARLFPFHDGHIAILRLDAVPEPSLHRPLNFFGDLPLNQEQARPPASLDERPEDSSPAVIFVAAHYPSSFIHFGSNPKSWLVSKMRHSRVVYLSGHLHTLMGFCPRLYFSKPGRFLDLELADLRFSRRFRIIVMNHALNEFGFRDFSLNPDSGGSGGKVPDWMLVWLRIPTADSESETLNRHGVPNTHWLKFVVWFTQRNCLFPDFEVTLNGVHAGQASRRCDLSGRQCLYALRVDNASLARGARLQVSLRKVHLSSEEVVCGPEYVSEILHTLAWSPNVPIVETERPSMLCQSVLTINMPNFFRGLTVMIGITTILLVMVAFALVWRIRLKAERTYFPIEHPGHHRRSVEKMRGLRLYGTRSCWYLVLATVWLFLGPWIVTNRITDDLSGAAFAWSTYISHHGWTSPAIDLFWLYGIQAAGLLMLHALNLCVRLIYQNKVLPQSSEKAISSGSWGFQVSNTTTAVIVFKVHLNNLFSLHGAFGLFGVFTSPVGVPFMVLSVSLLVSSLRHRRILVRSAILHERNR